jgi:hypothetical protein
VISRNLPPLNAPAFSVPGGHSYPGAESEITPDLIEMGSQLGCPFLAGLKKPEFAESATQEGSDGAQLCKSNTTAAATAAVAGSFGLAGVAGACPHMSKPSHPEGSQPQA